MHEEIQRKTTSLILMAIMVAGGMTFAVPGMMPAAYAANENLVVSAENSQFENYMAGPQVIEVVISDSDLRDTDESEGEPDVTVNGQDLRMVQATDGQWYGYFAEKTMAENADDTVEYPGKGLDFGTICYEDTIGGVSFSDADGVAIPSNATADCTTTGALAGSDIMNVLRGEKEINPERMDNNNNITVERGQIGLKNKFWPIIQLYDLNPTGSVVVQYNAGGGVQSTSLTFDTVDGFAGIMMDGSKYTPGSQVHATVTDTWLNIDPTDEDSWSWDAINGGTYYQVFDQSGNSPGIDGGALVTTDVSGASLMQEDAVFTLDPDAQGTDVDVVELQSNSDAAHISIGDITHLVTLTEQGPNSGVFGTYDESDTSILTISNDAKRQTSATVGYNDSPVTVLAGFYTADVVIQPVDDTWNSGETIPVVIVDGDQNKNSRADEDLILSDPNVSLIPALSTGDPFTLGEGGVEGDTNATVEVRDSANNLATPDVNIETFSDRAVITYSGSTLIDSTDITTILVDTKATIGDLQGTVMESNTVDWSTDFKGYNLLNYDIRSLNTTGDITISLLGVADTNRPIASFQVSDPQGLVVLTDAQSSAVANDVGSGTVGIQYSWSEGTTFEIDGKYPIVTDFFSFGFTDDGEQAGERVANQIIRIEAEESGDNTSTFEGELEYAMVNQLNILDEGTYSGLATIASDPSFIVIEDLTDEDSPRVSYNDLGEDGVITVRSDQEPAPSHSGVVSLNQDSYKVADTVVITLEDADLNVDSDLLEIYTVVDIDASLDADNDQVGNDVHSNLEKRSNDNPDGLAFGSLGRLLDVTFDDAKWTDGNDCSTGADFDGLGATGFTLAETGSDTGIFTGDFQIPSQWCRPDATQPETTTGLDIEVNYVDFRDASGEIIEVGDSAGVRANTGSVSLDRTVYPVPFGTADDFADSNSQNPDGRSVFPIHQTGMGGTRGLDTGEYLANGDLTIHIRVNDPDFDVNASGEDSIATTTDEGVGPVKVSVTRGSSTVVLGYAGGPDPKDGLIDVGDDNPNPADNIREFGPISEIAPDAGIYELDLTLRYTDGPADNQCPNDSVYEILVDSENNALGNTEDRFDVDDTYSQGEDFCILQGDILQVEYTDPTDASGDENSVTDSATFDLRNGVLQSDKSVYIIGSDMILTLIEPDLDLDNDGAETYDLDLIEWDSDAATTSMGDRGVEPDKFDPEPTDFRETGDSTGIFQVVIEVPDELAGDRLERGEEIALEYTDWGPSGSDYVGDEDEDVNLTVYTSNFGATIELDQKVYTWTDKVYITIVAPDHNFDGDLVDEIGDTDLDPIKVSTRDADLDQYKLVETGTDTGIFTGEVILTGFRYDADGDSETGDDAGYDVNPRDAEGNGPTDGLLPARDDDGLSISFEFSEKETVVASALVRWNIGEVQWLEASYPASGTGVVRIIDPDMNLDPEAVDNFEVDVWSDSDSGGIGLTVTETNEATGIFEGTVFFTVTDVSTGHRLRVAEGDTVTASYDDYTLPEPYDTGDSIDVKATSLIGTVVPPLERAPVANLKTVDSFGNTLDSVSVDQQVQVSADLANGQDKEQLFAYLVQIQDANGVTVSLSWIDGELTPGQSFSPAVSWIPADSGAYTATAFVWESVTNPTALSPPLSTTINVS